MSPTGKKATGERASASATKRATKVATKAASKTTRRTVAAKTTTAGFTASERAAMRERARELKAKQSKAESESTLLAKIAEMREPDCGMATALHAIIKANAQGLIPKTWYGMPAYANQDGKVVCFFQSAQKFGARYATLGFNDAANLDDGAMWPTAFALKALSPADEKRIAALVRQAVG